MSLEKRVSTLEKEIQKFSQFLNNPYCGEREKFATSNGRDMLIQEIYELHELSKNTSEIETKIKLSMCIAKLMEVLSCVNRL